MYIDGFRHVSAVPKLFVYSRVLGSEAVTYHSYCDALLGSNGGEEKQRAERADRKNDEEKQRTREKKKEREGEGEKERERGRRSRERIGRR